MVTGVRPPFLYAETNVIGRAGREWKTRARPVEIDYFAARVHQFERQRLEVGSTADDVVLFMLRHVQGHAAETVTLGDDLCAHCVFAPRPQRRAEAGELGASYIQRHVPLEL